MKVKTALISVSDKTGLLEFAKKLSKMGVKIISSGGTHKALSEAGIKSMKVEEATGFPEILNGRVKTLHPKIEGGILAKRDKKHLSELGKHGIEPIDLVVVNLYPFRETVSKKNVSISEAIENIDIGGPTMIRAAAKNFESVGVVVEPEQYEKVLADLKKNGFCLSEKMRKELAIEAFEHTAFYDATISRYLNGKMNGKRFPKKLSLGFEKVASLRYGENPHQEATLYVEPLRKGNGIVDAEQLNGKELSFNNYSDADTALGLVKEFSGPCCVIVKHANPCGVALGKTIAEALSKALECDPESAFGGIIALNRKCDSETAGRIASFFNEVVVAPDYDASALGKLKTKKNLRILKLGNMGTRGKEFDFRHVNGGLLVQNADETRETHWEARAGEAGASKKKDLEFAWRVVKHVKSNAIVIAKNSATVGIGVGQTSRVKAVKQALEQAGEKAKGSALASDAFFPFKDSIEIAAEAGVSAIVEPGGSLKDAEVVEEAKKRNIALYFTSERHFRH